MKILLFLLASPLMAQTAALPALPVPIPPLVAPLPAVVDPGQTATCLLPRNGGTCTIRLPARTLLKASTTTTAPATSSTAPTVAPVTSPKSYTFTCTIPPIPGSNPRQPDFSQPLTCTAKAQ